MQRRKFLSTTTTAAVLALPMATVAAKSPTNASSTDLKLSLLSSSDGSCFAPAQACDSASGPVRVRVSSAQVSDKASAGFRIWFAGNDGQYAFEAASVTDRGASSPLKFHADARHLVSAEVTWQPGIHEPVLCAQCVTSEQGLGHLKPGQHWLVLHSMGEPVSDPQDKRVLARLRLDVAAA